ncbi:sodium-dependent lysophosphatidylcholine symporter 1 [Brachionus plicatilis]|uniref:Sodium-dependent lysophosphatidylcholine symporter 1 n=1 Tax=Brachionus plicatilis TaxID=10195 RepID=A0A3M7RZ17_BRAPC|nr:sodium-dependent lysophosphatidylcholine symporter 1 [Brachionus plicatilis]
MSAKTLQKMVLYVQSTSIFRIKEQSTTGCAILFVPFWKKLMMKIEKTTALIIGNLTMIPLLIGVFFFKTDHIGELITFFGLSIIGANCFTAAFLIPPALIPEALDSYFLKYRTRPDALFYTFFTIGTKILIAIYLGISQEVLAIVGYKTSVCSEYQNEEVQESIKYLIAPLPLVFLVLSSVCIYFYPIDSKKAEENSRESTQSEIYTVESKSELIKKKQPKRKLCEFHLNYKIF